MGFRNGQVESGGRFWVCQQGEFRQRIGSALSRLAFVTNEAIEREEIVTGSLDLLMLPFAGALQGEPEEGLTVSTLLQTSEETSEIETFMALNPSANYTQGGEQGRKPLAIRLQGTFKTAFPDGVPEEPAAVDNPEEEVAAADKEESLKESSESGVVILVSDADMLYDRFVARNMNLFGHTIRQPLNDNLAFLLNIVEQLSGSEALIGLRSRGTSDRPFDRVIALEKEARQRWQKEEALLTDKLRQSQARLSELQNAKKEDQQFILSPEQKREIEKFRKEKFETQRRLREVRKNLRREIEALGLKLKLANMALVPLGVIVFGLVRGWRIRKQSLHR